MISQHDPPSGLGVSAAHRTFLSMALHFPSGTPGGEPMNTPLAAMCPPAVPSRVRSAHAVEEGLSHSHVIQKGSLTQLLGPVAD